MSNLFELASREGFRFNSSKGLLTVEDLWKLPLTSSKGASLNDVAKAINAKLKEEGEEDFVTTYKLSDKNDNKAKLDIVKYIIDVRLKENEAANNARKNKELKSKIQGLIAQKQDEALLGKSIEELQELASTL